MSMTAEEAADKAQQDRSPIIIGVAVMMMSLSVLMVGLRLWCRRLVKSIGLDDIAAVIALTCIIGCGSAMIAMTHYGLGRHEWTVPGETMILYYRCFWISVLFYMMALFWSKMTFLLQYYRIMEVSNMRWVCLGAIIAVAMWGASQAIMVFLQCIPLQAVWDPRIKGRCIANVTKWWYINGIVNIVSDFAIMLLPIPLIWKLNMPRSQKIILSGIFGLGFFTIAVSILRLQWLTPRKDVTWWNITAASWSLAEIFSAIACSCLPTFKPLLAMIGTSFRRLGKGDSTDRLRKQSNPEDTELSETGVRMSGSGPQIPSSIYKYGTQTHIVAH
ncbi:hypothetical protein FSARC_4811 [Fusarium sarcochroum]|uniref:Rhodopsin domain-containing protein n=1 Tax=Fusarium sarcochroum TaxID=1208366 RepID=A0A8H4U0W6_9HYPO|nr:hypothetical protein FSARC_4811 [Fusarium sarcochroum]